VTQKAQTSEVKLDKWDAIKLKSFYTEKKIIRVERQSTEQDEIFLRNIFVRG
jgi:hypothetical protein